MEWPSSSRSFGISVPEYGSGMTSARCTFDGEMPTPLPAVSEVLLRPPDAAEVGILARGITTAVAPAGGLTHLQNVLITAVSESMTGHTVDLAAVEPMSARD